MDRQVSYQPDQQHYLENDPEWLARQAYAQSMAVPLPTGGEPDDLTIPPNSMLPPKTGSATVADWSGLKTGTSAKLAAWPGMGPELDEGDASEFAVKRQTKTSLWVSVGLVAIAIGGLLAAIISERNRSAANAQELAKSAQASIPAPLDERATVKPAIKLTPKDATGSAPAKSAAAVVKDIAATGTRLLTNLFEATSSEARQACVAEGVRHSAGLDSFFSPLKGPVKLTAFHPLGTPVKALPGDETMTLCEVVTNYRTTGTAITRLLADADGSPRLDWPMLRDSLEGVLATYAAKPSPNPQWVTVGLKRNFGFGELESVRKAYFAFDIQSSGDGTDRTLALVSKSSPTGRAFDKMVSWNELYIIRCLLNWTTIEGQPRLTVLDAELVSAGGDSQ